MTRVAVLASSPAVRAGLAALIRGRASFTVLETLALPADLGHLAESLEADVVLLALEFGEQLPLPVSLAPDAAGRAPAVVVLGDDPAAGWAQRALRSGARGVLPRTATADQIAAAIAAAAAGLTIVPAGASGPGWPAPRRAAPTAEPAAGPAALPAVPLTPRELEVLAMLAEGMGNKAVANRLGISEHTVKTHVAAVFAKLGVSSRAQAVASAARSGLLML